MHTHKVFWTGFLKKAYITDAYPGFPPLLKKLLIGFIAGYYYINI
jgi:hypothetical protein